jgi:hypothetical protein
VDAHCECGTTTLFATDGFDFFGTKEYCCGSSACQAVVKYLYSNLDSFSDNELESLFFESCLLVDCASSMSYSYSFSSSAMDAMVEGSMSYSFGSSCTSDCSEEVLSAIGDQERLCALENLSCVSDCVIPGWVDAHCECGTTTLFATDGFGFFGSEEYCCGSSACQAAVAAAYGYLDVFTEEQLESALLESCLLVDCVSSSSYSYSFSSSAMDAMVEGSMSYSFGSSCTSDCSEEVLSAIGDQERLCALENLSCVSDCVFPGWVDAHCECGTTTLFASDGFDFFGTKEYCCGSSACQAAVTSLHGYFDTYSEFDFESALSESCLDVDCGLDIFSFSFDLKLEPSVTPSTAVLHASGCFKNCGEEVWDAIGNSDDFCALSADQRSCMSVEGAGVGGCDHAEALLHAHCACGSLSREILFIGTSVEMDVTGSTFCFGDASCRNAVVDLVQALVGSDTVGGYGAWNLRDALYSELALQCVYESFEYNTHPNASLDWSCLETCPGEALAVLGDEEAFCALDYFSRSCLRECVPQELLELHCECNTGLLFSSSEVADIVLTSDVGVFSQLPKELDYNETLFCYGSDLNATRPLPPTIEACRAAIVDYSMLADGVVNNEDAAYSWDDQYADLDDHCSCLMTCSDAVRETVGDIDEFCALPDEELVCMLNTDASPLLRAVHCSCHSGMLFYEKEWGDFDALSHAYCCANSPTLFGLGGGGDDCQAAVLALALSLDENDFGSAEMALLLASQCDDVDDDSGELRYMCATAAPSPSPSLTLAPTLVPCTATCTDELQDTMGDFDDFCDFGNSTAYNFSYCLSDAVSSDLQLEVHCACQSRTLFLSSREDYEVLGGEPYCCGSAACQSTILDLAVELDIVEFGDPRDTRVNHVNPDLVNMTLVAKAVLHEWKEEDAYIAGLFETAAYVAQLNYSDSNCTAAANCFLSNSTQVYIFTTDYGEYTYAENESYNYTYADYWSLSDRPHSIAEAYVKAEELIAQVYAGAVSEHRAIIQAGLEYACKNVDTGFSVYECHSPFPTLLPTIAPSAADTATVALSVKIVAEKAPNTQQKSTLKSVIAAQAGVDLSAIKNFHVTISEDSRRRNLLFVTWGVTFEITTSLSTVGDGDLSSSAELGSSVSNTLSSDDFTAAVSAADQSLEISVDTTSISAIASTRNPSLVPTPPPTALPTVTLYPTPLPTQCVDVGDFCEYVTSYCSVSFCRECPNAGICDKSCGICTLILSPTAEPTVSLNPSPVPLPFPTELPSLIPSPIPTLPPSTRPSPVPTLMPTPIPTVMPAPKPSAMPIPSPSSSPTLKPTPPPTVFPLQAPSPIPIPVPSAEPTLPPSPMPSSLPSMKPIPLPTLAPTPLPTFAPSSSPTINCIEGSTDNNNNAGIRKRLFRVTMRSTAANGGWGNYKYALTKLATVSSNKDDADSVEVATGTLVDGNKWDVDFLCLEVPTDSVDSNAAQCYYLDVVLDGATQTTHPASTIHWGIHDESSSIYAQDGTNFPDVTAEDASIIGTAEDVARVCAKRGSNTVIGGLFGGVPSPQPSISSLPSQLPTTLPIPLPSPQPTIVPTLPPSPQPSLVPSVEPTPLPTIMPIPVPTPNPTLIPSPEPTFLPTPLPTVMPFPQPSAEPTIPPTPLPTLMPFPLPSPVPTIMPSPSPTPLPTPDPTPLPTPQPTVACTEGRYFDYEFNGKSVCRDCPAGRYLNQTSPKDAIPANWGWKRECRMCPLGKAQPKEAQGKCNTCAEGQYSSRESAASAGPDQCRVCIAGEYAFNETECVWCELGRYAPSGLISFCIECPSGYYTGVAIKATECNDCSPGYYNAGADYYIDTYRAANSYELECTICPAVNSIAHLT